MWLFHLCTRQMNSINALQKLMLLLLLLLLRFTLIFSQATDDCDFTQSCCGNCEGNCSDRPLFHCSLHHCTTCHTIRLQLQNLYGTIPASISSLSELQFLKLSDNRLTGTIPPYLSDLSSLVWLSASISELTGTLPPSIMSLQKLTHFNLANNLLTGSLPNSICSLVDVEYLSLSNNFLSGTIPFNIFDLTNMATLNLAFNLFKGPLPSVNSLQSKATVLTALYLNNNILTGIVPDGLCPLLENVDACEISDGTSSDTNSFCCSNSECKDRLTNSSGSQSCGIYDCDEGCHSNASSTTMDMVIIGLCVGIPVAIVVIVVSIVFSLKVSQAKYQTSVT